MPTPALLIISVITLILLVLFIVAYFLRSKDKKEDKPQVNYKALFIMGICWLPIGISTKNLVFSIVGFLFMIIGLSNKKKWKEETKWEDLPPKVKKMKITIIVVLTIVLIAGIVTLKIAKM